MRCVGHGQRQACLVRTKADSKSECTTTVHEWFAPLSRQSGLVLSMV